MEFRIVNKRCENCEFFSIDRKEAIRGWYYGQAVYENVEYKMCHLNPEPVEVRNDHWCGQFKSRGD